MKNTLKFIQIFFFCFFIIACAKEDDSSSSSASTMSTPSIADGTYKLTATTQKVYYSNGTLAASITYEISHDSSVTPGYLALEMEWKGSGVYRITSKGKATLSASGLDDTTIDCTTNAIDDVTLDTDGNVTNETAIQTGCGGGSSSIPTVSQKLTPISGGFTHYAVGKDSDSNEYQVTYTFQKQSTSSSTTELEGTWVTSCYEYSSGLYSKKTVAVSGTNYTVDYEYFSVSNCDSDNATTKWVDNQTSLSIGDAMTFNSYGSSGGSGHKFTVTHNSTTLVWLSADGVSWANTNSYCGESDWVINVAQDVSGKTCGSSGDEWASGITVYGLYILDGTKYIPNHSSSSYPSSVSSATSNVFNKQ